MSISLFFRKKIVYHEKNVINSPCSSCTQVFQSLRQLLLIHCSNIQYICSHTYLFYTLKHFFVLYKKKMQFINNLYISQGTDCHIKANIFSGCSSSFLTIWTQLFEPNPALCWLLRWGPSNFEGWGCRRDGRVRSSLDVASLYPKL